MRIKCLAQGNYCQQIRTGDLTIESPWSYPLSHEYDLKKDNTMAGILESLLTAVKPDVL